MRIHYITVWSNNRNIGAEYNYHMSRIQKGDWACFIDGDAMFMTKFWGNQLQEIVENNVHVGMFTCMTNRVNNVAQLHGGRISNNYDGRLHRSIAETLEVRFKDQLVDLRRNQALSGVLMMIQRDTWDKVKFREKDRLAGIDNQIHYDLLDAGFEVKLMKGVYLFHYYDKDRSHLR